MGMVYLLKFIEMMKKFQLSDRSVYVSKILEFTEKTFLTTICPG